MNLVRFNRPVVNHRRVNNPLNDFLFSPMLNEWLDEPVKSCGAPSVNIAEENDLFRLEFSVAGYRKEDFRVKNDDGVLTVSAEVEENSEKQENYSRVEFRKGSFERSFSLPETVDGENIKARYRDGILTVEIPKKEVVKKEVKSIEISAE